MMRRTKIGFLIVAALSVALYSTAALAEKGNRGWKKTTPIGWGTTPPPKFWGGRPGDVAPPIGIPPGTGVISGGPSRPGNPVISGPVTSAR